MHSLCLYSGTSLGGTTRGTLEGFSGQVLSGSFSSRASGSRGSSGDRCGASGSGLQRGGHTQGAGFRLVSSGSSYFQGSADRGGFRSPCDVCGKVHDGPCQWDYTCFQCGQTGHSRGTAPIEGPARLESQNQVLGSNGLVDMGDRICRQGRPRVVPQYRTTICTSG